MPSSLTCSRGAAPSGKADWEIRVAGWFGAQPSETATPLAPEFAKIPGELIQCYYGVEEKDPGCLGLADKRTELI